jgi:hypothetical protein
MADWSIGELVEHHNRAVDRWNRMNGAKAPGKPDRG